jgi:hypothetical protein
MTFQLDTSGRVPCNDARQPCICHAATWDRLLPFHQGYTEAALRDLAQQVAKLPQGRVLGFRKWPAHLTVDQKRFQLEYEATCFRNLAPATLWRIIADCTEFLTKTEGSFVHSAGDGRSFHRLRQQGLYTHIGFPPLTVNLGDDGLIYLREGRSMNPALSFLLRNAPNGGLVVSVLSLVVSFWIWSLSQ